MTNKTDRQIVKRDGRVAPWSPGRIIRAVALAFWAHKNQDQENSNRNSPDARFGLDEETFNIVEQIAANIVEEIEGEFERGKQPSVDELGRVTEKQIAKAGHWEVARLYMLYRSKHDELRTIRHGDTGLQEYIALAKYAQYREDLGRRELYEEATDRVRDMHVRRFADKSDRKLDAKPFVQELGLPMELGGYIQIGSTLGEAINNAFDGVRDKRWLPSMRSMQFGGKAIEKNESRIFNCAYGHLSRIRSFSEAMFLLLSGTGVGFSVQRHHIDQLPAFPIRKPEEDLPVEHYLIPDTIEGWADSLEVLMTSYLRGVKVEFNYSAIRAKGTPLKSSGGRAPGHLPLKRALGAIEKILDGVSGRKLKPIEAYDIMMFTARAVLSGGIRRSATIALFSPDDQEMASAKTGNWFENNSQRSGSNNSAVLVRNEANEAEFNALFEKQKEFGEPGFYFSESAEYGTNPCCEISLAPYITVTLGDIIKLREYGYDQPVQTGDALFGFQMCNLTTINGGQCVTPESFYEACASASLIGTLQASYTRMPYLGAVTRLINEREALLGVSITGIMDSPQVLLNPEVLENGARIVKATNALIAEAIDIERAARTTAVKPEGCQVVDTMVVTSKGILELGEIGDVAGQTWQPLDGLMAGTDQTEKPMTKFFVNGMAKTRRVKLDSGATLEATPNHQYRVLTDQGEYIWKRMDQMQIGDLLPYKVGGYTGGTIQKLVAGDYKPGSRATRHVPMKTPTEMTTDLAWWLGLYFGDGSTHARTIRIAGDVRHPKHLDKAARIAKKIFGLKHKQHDYGHLNDTDMRMQYYWNSKDLVSFLKTNGLQKQKSKALQIPLIIRQSPPEVIRAFWEGLKAADGCTKSPSWSYVTSSPVMAKQLFAVLRAIGVDCKYREYTPSAGAYGQKTRFWFSERKGKESRLISQRLYRRQAWQQLEALGLYDMSVDKVVGVSLGQALTYDVEVQDTHTYVSNSYISHNTTSLLLNSGSGIHPHHAKRYFRRVQANRLEPVYLHFKSYNPHMTEPSIFSPQTDDLITFPVEAPEGAILRDQIGAIAFLDAVKLVQKHWVIAGRAHEKFNPGLHHNVSNTVTVRPEEWEAVRKFLWENREYFTGVSLLQSSGDKAYVQAPREAVTTMADVQKWNQLHYNKVDYTLLREAEDNTSLKDIVACAGGSCELF